MYTTPQSSRSDESTDGPPRKRTARACDSCYRRKIKCDAERPQCNWCKHHNIPCTFERAIRVRRKRKYVTERQSTSLSLAERMDKIEIILTEKLSNTDKPESRPATDIRQHITPAAQSLAVCFGKLHFAGRNLGDISSYNGIPFFSLEGQKWVRARTGQRVDFDKLCTLGPPWQNQRNLGSDAVLMNLQSSSSLELPDRKTVEEYVDVYNSTIFRLVFPVVNTTLFTETLNTAYGHGHANQYYQSASAKACIYSFLAFCSVLNIRGPAYPAVDSEGFALKAQCLLPQLLREPVSSDGLQTAVMMAIYELASGNTPTAASMSSLTARFIFMLGAHRNPSIGDSISPSDDLRSLATYHLRNLFWLCYSIDKDISLRTGQPPCISDSQCDLTLPAQYVDQFYARFDPESPRNNFPEVPLFPLDLRLSMIKSRAYDALYSVRALQKTDAELLRAIRELDADLERWRVSLPPRIRPTVSFSYEMPIDATMDMGVVMMRLDYHHCLSMIHQATSRCKAWAGPEDGVLDGVGSSLALSVEASRSTIFYLQTAEHVLGDDCFWVVLFYPMSAFLTIFCHVLLHPLHPQAAKDVELLNKAPVFVRGLFRRQISVKELIHLKVITEFVAELGRLAKCAIEKACSERST
ncbi:transcriptional regulator family: Fungal Specific TF [Paecilomyces variotii]|nr:transcriptional regulator family: Fungal Specific TF [Paecilomyces variotii]